MNRVHEEIENEEEPEDFFPKRQTVNRLILVRLDLTREEVETLLLTDAAQCVLLMDIPPRVIKRAIRIILHEEGRSGITAQNIMKTVFFNRRKR